MPCDNVFTLKTVLCVPSLAAGSTVARESSVAGSTVTAVSGPTVAEWKKRIQLHSNLQIKTFNEGLVHVMILILQQLHAVAGLQPLSQLLA
jgi:hypothetical protein